MKIALFADGTGNSASNPQKTNVWRAYQALDKSPDSGQRAFYDNGVGTSAFRPTALLGLAFGWGLARNVRQLYGYVVRSYREDEDVDIYCFGFSRGAYTIRVLVGLICSQGVINQKDKDEKHLDRLIAAAYRRYRREEFSPSLLSYPYRAWQKWFGDRDYDATKNFRYDSNKLIRFIGVWDTVGAYGGPVEELVRAWDRVIWPLIFRDRNLSGRVVRACHALALDEQRESFRPVLWNEKSSENDVDMTQVWFPGVHSNVGGSYPDDALSLVSLNWMLDQGEAQGLEFLDDERKRLRDAADVTGRLYDSRAGTANLYRYAPRHLKRLCEDHQLSFADWLKEKTSLGEGLKKLRLDPVHENRVQIGKPKIHHSVFERLKKGGDAYSPINIPADYAVVDEDGRVVDINASDQPGDENAAGHHKLPETPEQAAKRVDGQTLVWNKVWFLSVLHFVTLMIIAVFILYPYLKDVAPGDGEGWRRYVEMVLGTFSLAIRAIPELIGKIPGLGFAETWSARYEPFPYAFMGFTVAIIGLFCLAWRINASLKSEMRLHWHHVTGSGGKPPKKVSEFSRELAAFLNKDFYSRKLARPWHVGLEVIAVVFLLWILLAVASRFVFVVTDGFGGICEPVKTVSPGGKVTEKVTSLGESFEFDSKDPCFATGVKVVAGQSYTIDLSVTGWRDGSGDGGGDWIDADVDGWRTGEETDGVRGPAWFMSLFTPFRRHLLVDWYRIVARVDDQLFDRHPLHDSEEPAEGDKGRTGDRNTTLHATFTPRRSGELYLYVNDAVFFTPSVLSSIYDNNDGKATVVVNAGEQ